MNTQVARFVCICAFGIGAVQAVVAQGNLAVEMRELKQLASKGDASASIKYGQRCMKSGWQFDLRAANYSCTAKEGLMMIKKHADSGDAEAQFIVGEALRYGVGIAVNFKESFRYLLKSAKQGKSEAQEMIGQYYETIGVAVPKDVVKAYAWYSIAFSDPEYKSGWIEMVSMEKRLNLTDAQINYAQEFAKKCQQSNFVECPI